MRAALWTSAVILLLFTASLFQASNPYDRSAHVVVIPAGASARDAQTTLEEAGILKHFSSFAIAARLMGVSRDIQAGEYRFSPSENILTILFKLKKGETVDPEQLRVTFPEGTSIYKMGEILKKAGFARWRGFQAAGSLEGYLYPDTYLVFAGASVNDLVRLMLARFDAVVMPFWKGATKDTKFSLHEILTLASIIEKEAKVSSEREIISSVFYNRLKAGMPLAADPTVKYALERPTKRVYLNQLSVDSPYNTYKRRGLPPGPICNPGIESIKAAVHPAKTDYLFFVANKDGSHTFSRNWEEHQKARQKVTR